LLASIHELNDESDGYATPLSDLYVSFQEDDIIDEDGVIPMDGAEQSQKETGQGIEEMLLKWWTQIVERVLINLMRYRVPETSVKSLKN